MYSKDITRKTDIILKQILIQAKKIGNLMPHLKFLK